MSRTHKTEYHGPDGWHLSARQERKARPAGRIKAIVDAEIAADTEPEHWFDPDADYTELLEELDANRFEADGLGTIVFGEGTSALDGVLTRFGTTGGILVA